MVETKVEPDKQIEDLKVIVENRKVDEQIVDVIMGKDYTGILKVGKYEFYVHSPSIEDQIKIIVESRELRKGFGASEDDVALIQLTDTLATFNRVVDKMTKLDGGKKAEITEKFWDYFKKSRNPKVYENVISPLNAKYAEFIKRLSMENEGELKNG